MSFPPLLWACTCSIMNLDFSSTTGWVFHCSQLTPSVRSATHLPTASGTTIWDVVETVIKSIATTSFEMQFFSSLTALVPRRELPHLIPNHQSRPADIFLLSWDRGRPAALDISVISTLQNLTVQGAASTPGHAL